MIWLTWKQFRAQAIAAALALLTLAVLLVFLGLAMRHSYDTTIRGCERTNRCDFAQNNFDNTYSTPVGLLGVVMLVAPGLIGVFWGAPLIARELESGTCRLAWSQSVTRTRWLATKLTVLTAVSAVVAGLFSLLLTWATWPWDHPRGDRFVALTFAARDITPVGYAVFAFVLGTTLGLLLRRTLPAMALTLAVFAGLQVLMPLAVRPHLVPPVKERVAVTAASMQKVGGFFLDGGTLANGGLAPDTKVVVQGYSVPGAWVLTRTSQLLTSLGRPADPAAAQTCMNQPPPASASGQVVPGPQDAGACLSKLNLHFDIRYQPAGRYWLFQGLETAIFLLLALGLAGLCFRVIPRGLA